MATGIFNNGDYTEEDDSNGDYRILDPQGNVIFRWDESNGEWNFENNPLTNLSSVSTDTLTIGGKVYEKDANSPINVSSTSSTTYTVGNTYDEVIILADPTTAGFDQLQVNGDTGSNYQYVDNSDTQTTGATEWPIPRAPERESLRISNARNDARIKLSVNIADSLTGQTVGGRNSNISGAIDKFTLKDSGSSSRDLYANVYGRDIQT